MPDPKTSMTSEEKLDHRISELCRILNGLGQMPYTKGFAMGALRATTTEELEAVVGALKDELAGVVAELDTV